MNGKTLALAGAMLALGLAVGFFFGRASLEAEWSKTTRLLSPAEVRRGGENSPAVGTRVLVTAPLRRARIALEVFAKDDPVVVTVGSFSRGEDPADIGDAIRQGLAADRPAIIEVMTGLDYHAPNPWSPPKKG